MTSAFPGRAGRIQKKPESAGFTVEGIRMTNQSNSTRLAIAADIRLLAANCRGPAATMARICDWACILETEDAEAAFEMDALQQVCKDLVQISHANAGFSLAPAPDDSSEPMLEINDRGGYLLARLALAAIEQAAPIGPQGRAELGDHIRSVTKWQIAEIVGYLKRS